MNNVTTLAGNAAAVCATAAGRLRRIDQQLENGGIPGTLSTLVDNDIDRSVDLLAQLRDALASQSVDLLEQSPLGRSLRAIGNAVNEISGVAQEVIPVARRAGFEWEQLPVALGQLESVFAAARQQFEAAVPGAVPLPQIFDSPFTLPRTLPSAPGATSAHPHLLILSTSRGATYHFGLTTAAFDKLKRKTEYNVASQERLTRRPALQSVSKGGDAITLSGVIFPAWKGGARQIETLRDIGYAMEPVTLTTGYGAVLGRFYLTEIEEEQEALFSDGAPRKQTFSLEFRRYGEDYQNV